MSRISGSVKISRPGGDLELIDLPAFDVLDFAFGGLEWDHQTVEGRYQHGAGHVGARLVESQLVVRVKVSADSYTQLRNRVGQVVSACSQFSLTVTANLGGGTQAFDCWAGNVVTVGSAKERRAYLHRVEQVLQLSFPTSPVGVSL